mgnify:CR=1 FL=1
MDRISGLGYIQAYSSDIVKEDNLQLSKEPTEAKDVATKDYVDAVDAKVAVLDGKIEALNGGGAPPANLMIAHVCLIAVVEAKLTGPSDEGPNPEELTLTWSDTQADAKKVPFFMDDQIEFKNAQQTFKFLKAGTVIFQGSLDVHQASDDAEYRDFGVVISKNGTPVMVGHMARIEPNAHGLIHVHTALQVEADDEVSMILQWNGGLGDYGDEVSVIESPFVVTYYHASVDDEVEV